MRLAAEPVLAGRDGVSEPAVSDRQSAGAELSGSRLIALVLAACVSALMLGALLGVFWLSREHDRLAANNQSLMVSGGIANLEQTLTTITLDFAVWPAAVEAERANDMAWLWENIGISAAETLTTDLMMVVPTSDRRPFGWTPGMDAQPSHDLLSDEVIADTLALLNDVPLLERAAPTRFAQVGGDLWLLSAARIVSNKSGEVPTDDAEIPRLVFGFKVTDEKLAEIGGAFLIPDLHLTTRPDAGEAAIPLIREGGRPVRYAAWSPLEPGPQVLETLALPLFLGFAVLIAVGVASAGFVRRIAAQLERARDRARAADNAKTDFLANVSHELRTPMNGIIGIAELLERTELDERQRMMLRMLNTSAAAQMRLVQDLLDITTIEAGRLRFEETAFAPADVVAEAIDMQRHEAEAKSIYLRCECGKGAGLRLIGDPNRVRQIVNNLVSNAIAATSEGGVTVRVGCRESGTLGRLELEIADTGSGIPEKARERVFDRFVQLEEIGRRSQRGTGLGLTITKSLVYQMNGRIELESEVGLGSVFRVEIPLKFADDQRLRVTAA